MYRIREVDAQDDDVGDTLAELHRLTFFDAAPVPAFDHGHWWLALHGTEPVAFAGVIPSTHVCNAGYFCRVGVLRKHGGNRLQLRLMRGLRGACAAQRLVFGRVGHDRESFIREQFHPSGLQIVPAAAPLGMASYNVLAQTNRLIADLGPAHTASIVRSPGGLMAAGLFLVSWTLRAVSAGACHAAALLVPTLAEVRWNML